MQRGYDEQDGRNRRSASSSRGASASNSQYRSSQGGARSQSGSQYQSERRVTPRDGASAQPRQAASSSYNARNGRSAGNSGAGSRNYAGNGNRSYTGGQRGMGMRKAHNMDEVRNYSSSTHYDADTLKKYSRSNYTNSSNQHSRQPASKSNRLKIAIVALIVAAAVGCAAWFYHTMPKQITVNGIKSQVAYNMTYQGLHDKAMLTETNGDLLAVDGSLIQTGGGDIYKIYSNGELVTDYNARVKKDDVITEAEGDNTTEDYTETDEKVPWTWDIAGGTDYNFYNGSLTLETNVGSDGINRTFTGVTSGKSVLSDTSTPMVPRTYKTVTYTPADGKLVCALTFDDGPSEYTEQVMDVLEQYGVKGTFFELGGNVDAYPEISKEVVTRGHQVASHGYTHGGSDTPYMNEMTADQLTADLTQAYNSIEKATGETADQIVVRPSGGNLDYDAIVNANGMVPCFVGWDVDTEDWRKPGADTIVQTAMDEIFPGAIILMHDGGGDRTQTIEALQTLIPKLQSQGYTFVTVNELIQMQLDQYKSEGIAISTQGSTSTTTTTTATATQG